MYTSKSVKLNFAEIVIRQKRNYQAKDYQ